MSGDGRGSTGVGRPARMPQGRFDAPAPLIDSENVTTATFFGDDGRTAEFPVGRLPLPDWIEPIGQAFAARVGPAGSIRTRSAASAIWGGVSAFVKFLGELPAPPRSPRKLAIKHMHAYEANLRTRYGDSRKMWEFIGLATSVLRLPPVWDMLSEDVRDYVVARRIRTGGSQGPSGYSDGELRRLTTRLREDVAGIRDRIESGMSIVERYKQNPDAFEPELREHARVLVEIASTGVVPDMAGSVATRVKERRRLAMQLFLVPSDLVPLSALFIVLSHRNVETIKELPSTCRVIEDRAVEVTLVKRRRGPNHWFETVNWEIGPPGAELHHPGALFLMVQRLTALSRRFSGAQRLWAIWRNGWHRAGVTGVDEHFDPYTKHLQWPVKASDWSDGQPGLWADRADGEQLMPLQLDCVRLKKSMEVRRIKQMGGHLPSSARSNTFSVLYASYLRDDATVRDWADDVVAGALTDAEEAAWQTHREILRRAGDRLTVVGGEPGPASLEEEGIDTASAERIAAGEHDTAWAACADPNQHPMNGKPCRTPSVLDCFHCGNCVVTRDHLPRLLALLDAMQQRRALLSEELWWRRYGPSWVAIRRDIIDGRHFTAAEIEQARLLQPDDAMLDLVENPWEDNP